MLRKKPFGAFSLLILVMVFISSISAGSFAARAIAPQVTLSFEAYDLNMSKELRINVNGQVVASIPAADNPAGSGVWTTTYTFDITAYCTPTGDILRFDNPFLYGASRVRNVRITSNGNEVLYSTAEARVMGASTAPVSAIYGPFYVDQSTRPSLKLTAWYGIGEDYKLTMAYDSTGNPNFLNDWLSLLNDQRFSQWNFSVVRLDFHFSDLGTNPNFADDVNLDYDNFASVVRLLASHGYKVVATDHSWADFGSSRWMNDWTNFVAWVNQASNLDVRNAIVAYELRNECGEWTYAQGPWWNGLYMPKRSSPPSGWNWWDMVTSAYAELTDRIRTIQPNALVTWADPVTYYQTTVRLQDRRDGVVYSWHVWTNDTGDKGHTEPIPMANWAAGPWMDKTKYPNSRNWVGEFGSWYRTRTTEGICTYEGQKQTYTNGSMSLMQWCVNNNVGFSMHLWKTWNKEDEYSDWLQTINFVARARDANGDHRINSLDIGTLNAHWSPASGTPPWSLGYSPNVDCNDDGYINSLDIGVVDAHWGQSW